MGQVVPGRAANGSQLCLLAGEAVTGTGYHGKSKRLRIAGTLTGGREYMRFYMHEYRGQPHLNSLEAQAKARGVTGKQLARRLIEIIVRDDLFDAVLDGELERRR